MAFGIPGNREEEESAGALLENGPSFAEAAAGAARGNAEAQFALAICYLHGRGVAQDFATAVKWLQTAAAQGHAGAEDALGARYATGQGVPQSDVLAVNWFRRAAERGLAVAQFNLALAYVYGQGVSQSYTEAYVWFSLSALQGDEMAAESRNRVAEAFTYEQLQDAKLRFYRRCRELRKQPGAEVPGVKAVGFLAKAG